MSKKIQVIRYKENPFLNNFSVPMRGKQVAVSSFGKDDNVLVNKSTGEMKDTHVVTYKKVDAEQFVKLFSANIALTFDLKSAGIKAFNVLIFAVQHNAINKDLVKLDKYQLESFLQDNFRDPPLKMSMATFWRGLAELEKSKIIAKSVWPGDYFLNPNFTFNGNRIAFTTIIEKAAKGFDEIERAKLEENGQQRIEE